MAIVTVCAVVGLNTFASGPAADGAPTECVKVDARGECIKTVPIIVPGAPGSTTTTERPARDVGDNPEPIEPAEPSPCEWTTVSETAALRSMHPDAPLGAIWQVSGCGDVTTGASVRWLPPGPAAPMPPPASAVASLVYATVKAQMQAPTVASDPPVGVAGVVNAPVFVGVTNWQPEIVDGQCVLGVCVTMTATPTLSFDPGDGSDPIVCEAPGSRYVPGGAPIEVQAEGACAHVYRMRTGAEGRPAEWPAVVSVQWTVSWTSNVAGAGGSFDPLTFSTSVPRAVDEVRAVVVDGSS